MPARKGPTRTGTFRPAKARSEPEPLGAVLSAFLEKTGLMRRAADEQIRDAWPAAVGEAVAPLTTLVGFRRGVLTVAVAGAALRQELASFRAAEVLAALNARLSGVRVDKLKVKLTSGG